MTRQRTKVFQLRLTPEEAALFKEKSEPYGSISHYIRCAVVEYSNVHVKQRLELIKELGAFYRKFQNELSWAGGNLNQSVKRANELSEVELDLTKQGYGKLQVRQQQDFQPTPLKKLQDNRLQRFLARFED